MSYSIRNCHPCAWYSAYSRRDGEIGYADVSESTGVLCLPGYVPVDPKTRFETKSSREIDNTIRDLMASVRSQMDSEDDWVTYEAYEVASKRG